MSQDFQLLMIGAMYENGGNTTHRFLDGHPEMFVYPFESQLGTRLAGGMLGSAFPLKYRWPVFPLDATPAQDYASIIDEECKVRARTPHVSKFRHMEFDFNDDERCLAYTRLVERTGRGTANNVAAFFQATFESWKDYRRSGRERLYVGYSPIITIDAGAILRDLASAHVLHIVRNPWSAFADTCKRPVPMTLANYLLGWTINQYHALMFRELFPDRFHLLRIEDVIEDPVRTLGELCRKLGLAPSPTLEKPSWNGQPLDRVAPWGTIREPTPEANRATALELSPPQIDEIRLRAAPYLDAFGYRSFL